MATNTNNSPTLSMRIIEKRRRDERPDSPCPG
jgi:hypothetical protein